MPLNFLLNEKEFEDNSKRIIEELLTSFTVNSKIIPIKLLEIPKAIQTKNYVSNLWLH